MARSAFLYNATDTENSENLRTFEVKGSPVLVSFAGAGCAKLQVAVGWEGSGWCCEAPALPIWTDYVIDCDETVLSECNVQTKIVMPGLYRFDISDPDATTFLYFTEFENLI